MGIFSKIKNGISSKANAVIDKAIDPAKELEMAILELEDGRKKALAELVSYKATAKNLENDVTKYKTKATEWERRAMLAVKAGDDDAAKTALREKKAAEVELAKIERDKHEAASYAIQLNKSRKEFETKLTMLKLRKGTLATQLASARSAGGDAFGNDTSVWDKFQRAEDRIDQEVIESEVDSALRGEELAGADFDRKLAAAAGGADKLLPATTDDPLEQLKAKMAEQKQLKKGGEVIVSTSHVGVDRRDGNDPDEALSTRLRDLALVELDALAAGLDGNAAQPIVAAFADDVGHALHEARTRLATLRTAFGGADPLNILDVAPRARASDAGQAGAERTRAKLLSQAEAARAIARLAELTAALVPKLFEADRRR